jgi:SEC-C motif domain protein
MLCACGTGKNFDECCAPYISGKAMPPSAEALMRSRYTAYTKVDIEYLAETLAPESRADFDAKESEKWAKSAVWKGLEILSVEKGQASDKTGVVEFTAKYEQNGKTFEHHEVSKFRKSDKGQWMFVDGQSHVHKDGEGHHHHHHHQETVTRLEPKIGRNDTCPCGSGKKYKKCHGAN